MDLVLKHMKARDPFEANHSFYALIETSGSSKEHDRQVCTILGVVARLHSYAYSEIGCFLGKRCWS